MYQTVVKSDRGGDIAITYNKRKMTRRERDTLKKYGIKVVTHREQN